VNNTLATNIGGPIATPPDPTTCDVCGHEAKLRAGTTITLCPNREAMWHATYNELLIRLRLTAGTLHSTIASLERDKAGIENAMAAARQEATRIAELLGD
jgi:hypothetical protein